MELFYIIRFHPFSTITFRKIRLILIFQLLFIASSFAIKSYQPVMEDPLTEDWKWQTFSQTNGLDIRCVNESKGHIMWFGLGNGVLKFDGYKWTIFDKKNGLPAQHVDILHIAKNDNIYAGAKNGLYVFKKNKWHQVYPFKSGGDEDFSTVNAICELHDGSIIASIGKESTTYSGLLLIQNNKSTLFCPASSYSLYRKEYPTTSIKIVPENLLVNKRFSINSMCEDKEGSIWFVVFEHKASGIVFNLKSITDFSNNIQLFTKKDGLDLGKKSIIKQINDGSIWIINKSSDKGIMIFKNGGWKVLKLSETVGNDEQHTSIIDTPNDGLWIGGYGIVYVNKNGSWKSYKNPEVPIPKARIQVFMDCEGHIWIIGYLYKVLRNGYYGGKWITFKYLNYQLTTSDKKKWFISVDNRVVVQDIDKWYSLGTEDGLPDAPNSVFVTSTGTIWVIGSDKGIAATAYYNGKQWHKETHPSLSWSVDNRAIFEDSKHRIWIGCSANAGNSKGQKRGVMCLKNPQSPNHVWKHYPQTMNLPFANAYGLGESKDNRIWAGGTQLRYFKNGEWKEAHDKTKLENVDIVKNIPNGLLWVGTRIYGLSSFDGKDWKNYNIKNGLINNSIIDVLPISDSNVWVATDEDFSRFDGRSWANNIFPKELIISREAGEMKFEKDNFIWINHSSLEWKHRVLFKKPLDNITRESFKTMRYKIGRTPPETYILSYNKEIPYLGNTYIIWTGEDSWNHTPKERLSYSYRFNGGEWSAFTEKTSEEFTQLKSGKYVMEVRARDFDFNIDPTPARIEFIVEYPIWLQPWFIILILTLLIIIFVFQIRIFRRNKKINIAKEQLEEQNKKITVQKDEIMKIAEREQESNQLRIKFFTNITHEFRTPLTLILGGLDKISTLDLKSEKQGLNKYLSMVHRNSQQLLRLINQLMDFRKAETSTMHLKASKGNVVKFTEYLVASFQTLAETNKIKLIINKELDEIIAWYDTEKYEKMVYNLISNAIKYTPEKGTVRVSIKLDPSKETYQIIVEDTGVGIPQDEIEKILEPFYQAKNSPIRNEEGTGIGLALVCSLVEIHHGTLSVSSDTQNQSKESFNTNFTITLPVGNDLLKEDEMIMDEVESLSEILNLSNTSFDTDEESEETIVDETAIKENIKQKILVIDDNFEIRAFIIDELSPTYDLIEAVNGKDGIEKSLEFLPDLVICDLMMPIMNGTEFCTQLKTDERLCHIPVILLTANNTEEQMIHGYETGADDYITKPFKTTLLELRIKNILNNRKLLHQRFKTEISLEPKSMAITSIDAEFIEKTIDAVDKNIKDEHFDVEDLSKQLNISVRQLHNKLTSLTDMSPGEFIRVYRLKRAAEFLVKKKASVSEIAYEFGFSNPKYFSKCFRQQFGMTPSEYVEKNS